MNLHKRELIGKVKLVVRLSALSNLSEVVAGRFRQFNALISCRQRCHQGVSKNKRLTRRFPGTRLLGRNPHRNRPILLSHKTVYHIATYGSQKRRRLDAAWIWLEIRKEP